MSASLLYSAIAGKREFKDYFWFRPQAIHSIIKNNYETPTVYQILYYALRGLDAFLV